MSKRNKNILSGVIAIIVAIVLFYAGVKYGEAHSAQANIAGQFRGNFMGRQSGARAGANGGLVLGQILSKDDKSITISLQGGGSRIVFFSASTSVMKSTAGTLDDLTTGNTVTIIGAANPDGSITAQSIQIRPAGMMPTR